MAETEAAGPLGDDLTGGEQTVVTKNGAGRLSRPARQRRGRFPGGFVPQRSREPREEPSPVERSALVADHRGPQRPIERDRANALDPEHAPEEALALDFPARAEDLLIPHHQTLVGPRDAV